MTDTRLVKPRRWTPELLLAIGLTAVAVLVRSRHLDWGLPDLDEEAYPLKKAFEMCGWGTGDIRLDPDTAGWPSLSFYMHMALQHLHYWTGRLTGDFADRGDYFLQQTTWTPLAVWARWLGVLASAVVVFVGARLGGRLAGWSGALIAGLILAASPMLTQHAQLITPDILLVMFTALALVRLVDIEERGRLRDYVWAGVWIGLGVSAKYTPVLLAPVLYLAHLMQLRRAGAPLGRLGLADKRLWWAAAACVAAFVITSPFVLADLDVLGRDVDYQVMHLQAGHFGHESQNPGLVFYVLDVLGPGLGWPAFLLGVSGLIAAALRKRGSWWVLLAAFLAYYLVLSLAKTRFDRYMLPALLPLAVGVTGWWALLTPWLQTRARSFAIAITIGLAVAIAADPALVSARFTVSQGKPGTLQQAKDWILQHRGQGGPYLAMELYTPFLPRAKQIDLRRADPAFGNLTPEQQSQWLDIDPVKVVHLPFYTTRKGASDFYYDLRHYLDYDFFVTSSAVRGRYERNPLLYQTQIEFYKALAANLPEVQVFSPDDDRRGPKIRIYAMTADARAHLLTTLPPITQDDFRAAGQAVVGSHFQDFVKGVAAHAADRGDFKMAATYYQPLYETLPPNQRDEYLAPYAYATLQAELWAQAEPLLQHWRRLDPANPLPPGSLGLARRHLGHLAQARDDLAACLQLAGTDPQHADLAAWARQQLAELEQAE